MIIRTFEITYRHTDPFNQSRHWRQSSHSAHEPTIAYTALFYIAWACAINYKLWIFEYLWDSQYIRRVVLFGYGTGCITACVSADWYARSRETYVDREWRHCSLSFSRSNSMSLEWCLWSVWVSSSTTLTHRNLRFLLRHSVAISATFDLHLKMALSSSSVTKRPARKGSCWYT